MRALVFRVGEEPAVEELAGFEGIRQTVGGHVERIMLDGSRMTGRFIRLWCDEDGFSRELTPNVWAQGPLYLGAPILGVAVLTATVWDAAAQDEVEVDLEDEEVAQWRRLPRLEAESA